MKTALDTVRALLKWLILGTVIGLIVGFIGSAFGHTLAFVNDLRGGQPWLVLTLPMGGLVIVFLYRFFRNTDDRGTNTILSAVHSSAEVPAQMAPLIFVSTTITHLCGGSAGREGAALQLGGSISDQLGRLLKLDQSSRRILVMFGMSAGFSALFGTPLAAAIFALEVASVGLLQISALVPCVTASMVAHFVAEAMRMPPEVFPVTAVPVMTALGFCKLVLLGALLGGVSALFCAILHQAEHWYKKLLKNPYIRIFAAGLLVILLTLLFQTGDYLGSGMGLIEQIFHTGQVKPYAFLLKMVFTALTLAAGFKGGEIVPSFTIGAAFGCTVAVLLGLPVELAAACGMAGVFCGVTNCPITALLISFELFGFAGMPYYLTAIAVSNLVSGRCSLYHAQKCLVK